MTGYNEILRLDEMLTKAGIPHEREAMADGWKICGSCEWHDDFSWVCCNGDSEYRAEFTNDSFTCDEWEKEE